LYCEVFLHYKKGRATGIREVAGKLRALIDQGDTTATIFYLKPQACCLANKNSDSRVSGVYKKEINGIYKISS